METYFSDQAVAFLWSLLLGAGVGLLYDFFRAGRILRPAGRLRLFLQDVLFSFSAAGLTVLCLTFTNHGQVRGYLLVGEGLGFLIYLTTVGAVTPRVFRWFYRIHKKIMNFFKKPFIFLFEWCKIILIRVKGRFLFETDGGNQSE